MKNAKFFKIKNLILKRYFEIFCKIIIMASSSGPTPQQYETLFSFMEEHRGLANGLFRTIEGRVKSRRLWLELTERLNAMGGPVKTVKKWQKVWADKKHLAKKKARVAKKLVEITGCRPPSPDRLKSHELRISNMTNDGLSDVVEAAQLSLEGTEVVKGSAGPTSEQYEALFAFMEEHRDLAMGVMRNVEGRVISKKLWQQITDHMNGLEGSVKSVKKWQKVWADKKHIAKKKAHQARVAAKRGDAAEPLTAHDLRIVKIMAAANADGFRAPDAGHSDGDGGESSLEDTESETDDRASPQPVEPVSSSRHIPKIYVVSPKRESEASETHYRRSSSPADPIDTSTRRTNEREQHINTRLLRLEEERLTAEIQKTDILRGIKGQMEVMNNLLSQVVSVLTHKANDS